MKVIIRSSICLLLSFASFTIIHVEAFAGTNQPSNPVTIDGAPLAFKWDVGPKNSVVTQDFEIPLFRLNKIIGAEFSISFHDTCKSNSEERRKEIEKFTGDGSMQQVTKESANTDNPVVIPQFTPEEKEFLNNGGRLVSGDYFKTHPLKSNERLAHTPPSDAVWQYSKRGAGITIPVHIIIERIGMSQPELVLDTIIDTKGMYTGIKRKILMQKLSHGSYRLTVQTTSDTILPSHVETYLEISPLFKYTF